ncbi:uncharacterized protein YdhG (YjbR/CyaY superfamily) [Mumia flava]|uniref:Uncharacterized protein YdhG (YjbR/CyaY superfamily) n=1 Tax=Mumia flava TaxID=1348852 RepID=A0A0B2B6X9_9ACTN|nr:DUF1801 domain-containing protein [Mumia flava]PJJ57759.1 uncharacterized protein YdhG (YjbR/CyaY superfamily) [Mumia flava]
MTAANSADRTDDGGFTEAERAAMKERAAELRASGRGGKKKSDDLEAVLEKLAEMSDADRVLAERIHAIVLSVAPELLPKTWYGMPAYARNGKVVCFFQSAEKFDARYATFGFNDVAQLDDGTMWPTAFALTEATDANLAAIEDLVRRAAG